MGFIPRFAKPDAGGGGSFAITSVTGTKSHGSSITIAGAQFGTKSSAGPVIYDDATGASTPEAFGWDDAWPNAASGGASYNLAYRTLPTTNGSVSTLPHSHITKCIAGAHNAGAANTGANVDLEYYRTVSSYPAYTFVSLWFRMDSNWQFNSASENNKMFDWGNEHGGYDLPQNWYIEWGTGENSWESNHATNPVAWHFNSDDPSAPYPLEDPDQNGHGRTWSNAADPFADWIKMEYAVKWTQDSTGFVKLWENGTLKVDYEGRTDASTWTGTDRYDMIGGYSDERAPQNWRYMADVYYDHTLSRVILGNASTIGSCTIKEPQVCTAWSDTSITCTMKHGAIPTGSAWLYVFDASNNSTAGFAVTLV